MIAEIKAAVQISFESTMRGPITDRSVAVTNYAMKAI